MPRLAEEITQVLFARATCILVLFLLAVSTMLAQAGDAIFTAQQAHLPPHARQAQKFISERGLSEFGQAPQVRLPFHQMRMSAQQAQLSSQNTAAFQWQPLGPAAVTTPNYGLVSGRVSALALDPSDTTGNRLYVGTTGGGVWVAQNAGVSTPSSIVFDPLTDSVAALANMQNSSISIGAISVQPGGTGVILAGTGDPNDAMDSYYGAGILRSFDNGNSWTLISTTQDVEWSFVGKGFAGFAWSTVNPQLVVAAVSEAYEGTLVNAGQPSGSYSGLYYSTDSGATWNLATIQDSAGQVVQGPLNAFAGPSGNAVTSIMWNPIRQLFVAAVRFHGFYQSSDGITWTRMSTQPGDGLTLSKCPTNIGLTGSTACPVFRGTLTVNPQTGDTFAWYVDAFNQDQGLWQDQCFLNGSSCSSSNITFAKQWSTVALESNTQDQGPATIANGDYALTLAVVPSQQDTLLFAGTTDLWKCSLALGCAWQNTTNAATCMSAQVAPFQHALTWNSANPQEIFLGNDSGLWRSTDAVNETGTVCDRSDASHFQNLNGSFGSLAEITSFAQSSTSPYTMMAGLGVNGTAGIVSDTILTPASMSVWPQVLSGYGGPVAIDPSNSSNWYVNNDAGVSIYRCSDASGCSADAFGITPVISNTNVNGDGNAMAYPAPFLIDPLDSSQLLVGTCRIWRGPADGSYWTTSNAISPFLDGIAGKTACNGDALIRTIAALPLGNGTEILYAGMYGFADGGANKSGHIFTTIFNPSTGTTPIWHDLTSNPVTNRTAALNPYQYDISSIYIDPHDITGQTVYIAIAGIATTQKNVQQLYRSVDGGAHWADLTTNLPNAPANAVLVDTQNANTVYVATDMGVYFTPRISDCALPGNNCWSVFGSGLPEAPVTALGISSAQMLTAATYGRGLWQSPLWTIGTSLTTVSAQPSALNFNSVAIGTASSVKSIILTNTGSYPLTPTAITVIGDFSKTNNCVNVTIAVNASCLIQVTYAPSSVGSTSTQLIVDSNIYSGQMSIPLSGTGATAGFITLSPTVIDFGAAAVGSTTSPLQVSVTNTGTTAIPFTSITVSSPFQIIANACQPTSLAPSSACQLLLSFAPTQAGSATGLLTLTDSIGTQTTALFGIGNAPPTDNLSASSLSFSATAAGQVSATQIITLTNSGGMPLTSINVTASGPFQVSSNCSTQLTGPGSCTITVTFAPIASGVASGLLTITDSLRTQTMALGGIGVGPAILRVSDAMLNFSTQLVGTASAPITLTVSNVGESPMANIGFQMTGIGASGFSTGATTCGATLSVGQSCMVKLSFSPSYAGAYNVNLVVASSTLGVIPATVGLTGTGQMQSGLDVSPSQLNFATILPGGNSAPQAVTITNTSSSAVTGLVLTSSAQFLLVANSCTSALVASASCTANVVFAPTGKGVMVGNLTVTAVTVAASAVISLSGTGGMPVAIQLAPSLLNFGTIGVGATSTTQRVMITNSSTTDALNSIALSISKGWNIASTTCGLSLAPEAACVVDVAFVPSSAGAQVGTLSVTNGAGLTLATASLQGTGFDFSLAVSGSALQAVTAGSSASYNLSLATLNGTSGTFAFSCGALPANTACTFSPTTQTLNSGVSGSVVLQISTGHSTAANSRFTFVPFLSMAAIVLYPFTRKRRCGFLLFAVFFSLLIAVASGCTAAGVGRLTVPGGIGSGAVTAAGTYSVPVTVTSNGVQHAVTLTLTVE